MTIILGRKKIKKNNPERCNLIDQVIVLVQVPQVLRSLEVYMIVNFRAHEIS
jgi:hypothetical protein